MRVVDLLRPYEDGLVRIVDETPETINIRRHIFSSDDVAYERSAPGASGEVAPGTIVITVLGPDREQHGDPGAIAGVVSRLQPGARAIVLFGWEPIELPYHRILDTLTANRCQVLQVAGVDLGSIRTAAVIERVDELQAPRNALGEPLGSASDADGGPGADRLALELRLANEFVFGDFAARVLRTTVLDPARGIDRRRFEEYRAQTEAALKERDSRISKLETKLANLDSSSSLKLGRTLVGAARSPRGLVRLPIDLVRIWRGRG
jgi:hypothetical protein